MTTSLASHAGERARFIEHSLNLHGITYRYQVFVPDGWTAKHIWPVVLLFFMAAASAATTIAASSAKA